MLWRKQPYRGCLRCAAVVAAGSAGSACLFFAFRQCFRYTTTQYASLVLSRLPLLLLPLLLLLLPQPSLLLQGPRVSFYLKLKKRWL